MGCPRSFATTWILAAEFAMIKALQLGISRIAFEAFEDRTFSV
jgi:hypothetical protein